LSELLIRLREWREVRPDYGSPTHGVFLDDVSRTLADSLTREGKLEIAELRNGLYVKASSFVGVITIGQLRIVIEPKIQGMQLMRLLRYAYGLRDLHLLTRVSPSIARDSFFDLLIQQLLAEIRDIIAHGLHRRYVPTEARLANPRGRLDLQRIARDGFITAQLPCKFHPRIENHLLNQVVLSGLRFATGITQDPELRSELRQAAGIMEDVVSQIRLDAITIEKIRHEMNRLTIAYEPAITIIEILLGSGGVEPAGTPQQTKLPGFLFDMNRFFQRLLGRYLRDNLLDHEVREELPIRGMMAYLPQHNPGLRHAPVLKPDYRVKTPDGKILLLDAKYRDLWEEDLPREMLYQLSIYALSQKPIGRATILYPTMASNARDAVVRIYDSGNPRAEVVKRPVNLARLAALLDAFPSSDVVMQKSAYASQLVSSPA
jgi:5-methylcytosine-specific restriction enzyme subunit McrC